ncbi:MAG: hypothetical protein A2049_00420 [Elusimicrobia bacterium GWA2_62_23]|nr:MAG: hypothetical protein A2049_00420 [Elusimicrobia bacterium GWA2_62_23]OGR71617.1 MAG: hypothetical protein A2179_05135 [Elusimicrobia bacterium GWC2_63_65]
MTPFDQNPKDPLHGITLKDILERLVKRHGWEEMGRRVQIRCFTHDPSVKSSLTFLRKTPWARQKVEAWFIRELLTYREEKPAPKAPGELPGGG